MINNLAFENNQWLIWVVFGALIIMLLFIWKEKRNYPSPKFFINTIISVIAISALALLILKPLKYASTKPFKMAILTKGFNKIQLDSLKNSHENLVMHTYSTEGKIFQNSAIPESVFILGDGIKAYDLYQLDAVKTTYIGGTKPKGIIKIKYNSKNTIGNKARINGRYLNPTSGHKLVLETPNKKTVDSVIFGNGVSTNFQLQTNLKAQGNFLYYLTEKDSMDTVINSDPLPFSIDGDNRLNILVINDFPTFETKFLKNYLSEQGHVIAIRSQITKNRYKYEIFNSNKKLNTNLTQKNLEQYDLLVMDVTTLNKLSRSNRNNIIEVVNKFGLGVFIQADPSLFSFKNPLTSFKFNRNKITSVRLDSSLKNINVFPYDFKYALSLQHIHTNKEKILSAYKQLGLGKIGVSTIKNSYELVLNGHKNTYQNIWADLVESISKKNTTTANWNSKSPIAFENEPFIFTLATQATRPSLINRDSLKISLKQDIDIPTLWEGITYPKNVGWHSLQLTKEPNITLPYYVTDSTKWEALQSYKTIKENKRYFEAGKELKKASLKSAEPIDLKWLYLIFLMAIGYLWLQPKL